MHVVHAVLLLSVNKTVNFYSIWLIKTDTESFEGRHDSFSRASDWTSKEPYTEISSIVPLDRRKHSIWRSWLTGWCRRVYCPRGTSDWCCCVWRLCGLAKEVLRVSIWHVNTICMSDKWTKTNMSKVLFHAYSVVVDISRSQNTHVH